MAFTTRANLVIPELLIEAVQGEFAGATALYGSSAAKIFMTLPGDKKGGDVVKVPYFGILGDAEDITNEGDALTPEAISSDAETASVIHTGKAFSITQWAEMAAWGDPYAEASRQIVELVKRRWDKALIDVAVASLDSSYINDVTSTPGTTISYDAVIDTRMKWGDQQERIRLMTVHSKVFGDMMKLKDTTGRPMLTLESDGPEGFQPARFGGIPVVVSDKCKTSGSPVKYETTIFKEGALVIWGNGTPSVKTGEDILADADVVAIHHYFASHRYRRVPGSTKPGVAKLVTF